jgi:hypothetical protein
MSVLTGVATIAKTKAAVGLAVAALASGTAAVAAAPSSQSNADGSQQTNAQAFGHKVVGEVATCKGALTSGQHGIGKCVSAWVKSQNPGAEHRAAAGGNAPATRHRISCRRGRRRALGSRRWRGWHRSA